MIIFNIAWPWWSIHISWPFLLSVNNFFNYHKHVCINVFEKVFINNVFPTKLHFIKSYKFYSTCKFKTCTMYYYHQSKDDCFYTMHDPFLPLPSWQGPIPWHSWGSWGPHTSVPHPRPPLRPRFPTHRSVFWYACKWNEERFQLHSIL